MKKVWFLILFAGLFFLNISASKAQQCIKDFECCDSDNNCGMIQQGCGANCSTPDCPPSHPYQSGSCYYEVVGGSCVVDSDCSVGMRCCAGTCKDVCNAVNPMCWDGEVFVPNNPPEILCYDTDVNRFSEGACKFQGDGTGGLAGLNIGYDNCGGSDTGFWCQIGYCGPACSCSWANDVCGNVTNGCGFEQQIQTKTCTPAGCQPNSCIPIQGHLNGLTL